MAASAGGSASGRRQKNASSPILSLNCYGFKQVMLTFRLSPLLCSKRFQIMSYIEIDKGRLERACHDTLNCAGHTQVLLSNPESVLVRCGALRPCNKLWRARSRLYRSRCIQVNTPNNQSMRLSVFLILQHCSRSNLRSTRCTHLCTALNSRVTKS